MTFDELQATLRAAVATGKIGTPVALRLHVSIADPAVEPAAVLAAASSMADALFSGKPQKLTARCGTDDRQTNVMLNYSAGQTLLLSLVRGSDGDSLQLLAIGNHGLVRLEGGELFDPVSGQPSGDAEDWTRPIARSVSENAAVRLDN